MSAIRVMKAMDGQVYFRISWRKLISVIGALLLMVTQVSASLCVADVCSGQSSKADARCSGMAMPRSASSINAQSRADCCQLNPSLPPTFRLGTDTEKARAEFSAVPRGPGLPSVVAIRRTITRPLDSLPPDDVQSLFCTLLL
jgi:hypothetical protein